MTDDLLQAFQEGRKAERRAIGQWLEGKAYFTLSALVRAGAHAAEAAEPTIRPMTREERLRAAEKDKANDARPNKTSQS
jgi:hypothetical protein